MGWESVGALNHHRRRPRPHAFGGGGETEEGAEVSPQASERPAASRSMDEIQDPVADNVAAAWLRRSSSVPQVRFREEDRQRQSGQAEVVGAKLVWVLDPITRRDDFSHCPRVLDATLFAVRDLPPRATTLARQGWARDLDEGVRWGQLNPSRCSMRRP